MATAIMRNNRQLRHSVGLETERRALALDRAMEFKHQALRLRRLVKSGWRQGRNERATGQEAQCNCCYAGMLDRVHDFDLRFLV
jgi:hypothetical protein